MADIANIFHKFSLKRGTTLAIAGGLLCAMTAIILIGINQRAGAGSLTFTSVADTQISAQTPNTQYGGDVKMTACGAGATVCSADNADEKRGLVKFDVSGIETSVVSAKLRFHVDNAPVPEMQVKQTTVTDWQESTATWNTAASLPTTTATYTSPAGTVAGWYEVDVTTAVAADGTYGFVFYNSTSTASRIATKESVNAPQLLITTSDQTPPSEPVIVVDQPFNSVADTQISAQTPTSQYGGDVKMTTCGAGTAVCSVDNATEKRGLAKFDVSGLSAETTVVSAKLRFHVDNKPVPAFEIKQTTTTDWLENVTWNNAVNLPTTSASYSSPAASLAGWVEADVTGAVTGNGTYSFVFYNSTSTASRIATKESANVPKLLLTTSTETDPPVDPEPPVTGPLNTYLGTTHVHTGAENDHGSDSSTAGDVFAAAKSSGLDFTMLTEHSGPTGPTDALGFYSDAQAQATTYSADGTFVGLAGYEYSENGSDGDTDSGHMTGWGTQEFVNAAAPGMDFNAFYNVLITNYNVPRQVLAGFNHPVATGHPASVSSHLTPERRELVVMSETSNAVAYNSTEEAKFYQGFVAELDRGWRVAPTCGLDSHGLMGLTAQESATKKPCRTGLLAPTLTKDSLVDAFMQRRIYSTRDMNMELSYKANDFWMGSKIGTPTTAAFNITVADPDTTNAQDKITKIEVIGNGGAVLASQTFDAHSVSWQPNVTVGSNSYMFVLVYNGERTAHTAVAAPVWFE